MTQTTCWLTCAWHLPVATGNTELKAKADFIGLHRGLIPGWAASAEPRSSWPRATPVYQSCLLDHCDVCQMVVLSQTRWSVPYLTGRRIISHGYNSPLRPRRCHANLSYKCSISTQLQLVAEKYSQASRALLLAYSRPRLSSILHAPGIYIGVAGGRVAPARDHIQSNRYTPISVVWHSSETHKFKDPMPRWTSKTQELPDLKEDLQILESYAITVLDPLVS